MHAHGGLTAAVLDEVMGTVCWCNKISVMTSEFNIKYRRPVKLNTEIHGKLTSKASVKMASMSAHMVHCFTPMRQIKLWLRRLVSSKD